MTKVYLFDWGDTLMIDFPDQTGKMCDWENIQAVNGALQTLEALSTQHQIYVATNVHISEHSDQSFRDYPITHFGLNRSLIPRLSDHF
ncbi:hypothetical protein [Vibrio cidicii]|uniref:hypothetical protein n=1 Tax=Vibrio cidicii TaxID=1763883 RepID=UPI0018C20558